MTTTAAVQVRDLQKTYDGGIEAVRGIDFDVEAGEVFGLLGPNGAGKSTTIGMLTTTIRPTSGVARLCGHDVASDARAARGVSAVVFQESVVDRPLSGRRNLAVHGRLWGLSNAEVTERVDDAIDSFSLSELADRPVASYSGGERRRLEIARSLLSRPRVLFLDEPTVGLDPRMRVELLDLIDGLRDRHGLSIVLTTHYLDEAERLCDRVGIVHAGRIVALDSPPALLGAFGAEVLEVRVRSHADRVLESLRDGGVAGDDAFAVGGTITVPLHDLPAARALRSLAGDEHVVAVTTRPPTLDDVYLRLTGDTLAA